MNLLVVWMLRNGEAFLGESFFGEPFFVFGLVLVTSFRVLAPRFLLGDPWLE